MNKLTNPDTTEQRVTFLIGADWRNDQPHKFTMIVLHFSNGKSKMRLSAYINIIHSNWMAIVRSCWYWLAVCELCVRVFGLTDRLRHAPFRWPSYWDNDRLSVCNVHIVKWMRIWHGTWRHGDMGDGSTILWFHGYLFNFGCNTLNCNHRLWMFLFRAPMFSDKETKRFLSIQLLDLRIEFQAWMCAQKRRASSRLLAERCLLKCCALWCMELKSEVECTSHHTAANLLHPQRDMNIYVFSFVLFSISHLVTIKSTIKWQSHYEIECQFYDCRWLLACVRTHNVSLYKKVVKEMKSNKFMVFIENNCNKRQRLNPFSIGKQLAHATRHYCHFNFMHTSCRYAFEFASISHSLSVNRCNSETSSHRSAMSK